MPLEGPPPPLDWDRLDCRASIDFFTAFCEVKPPIPPLNGTPIWTRDAQDKSSWNLTVHDPTGKDVRAVIDALGDPSLMKLEVAVDLWPKPATLPEGREALLLATFKAVAGRFRPEDAAIWTHGLRGGVAGKKQPTKPFHRRFPSPDEELVYGHRGDFMQAKAYLKRWDQNAPLPEALHRVRLEVTLRPYAMVEFGMSRLQDLIDYRYRKHFAKHFRVIERPALRAKPRQSPATAASLEKKMWRAWKTAGVGKFAPDGELKRETDPPTARRFLKRVRQQLPREDYVLKRDQLSNAKIGQALQQLQRRMAS